MKDSKENKKQQQNGKRKIAQSELAFYCQRETPPIRGKMESLIVNPVFLADKLDNRDHKHDKKQKIGDR